MKVIVTVPKAIDDRFKLWRKHLVRVDTSKTNGYAFEGEWLQADRKAELPVGALILCYDERGSRKNHKPDVDILRVQADGTLEQVARVQGWSWALDLRDEAARLLAATEAPELTAEEQALVDQIMGLPEDRRTLVLAAAKA